MLGQITCDTQTTAMIQITKTLQRNPNLCIGSKEDDLNELCISPFFSVGRCNVVISKM